jgi:hypothetical protein
LDTLTTKQSWRLGLQVRLVIGAVIVTCASAPALTRDELVLIEQGFQTFTTQTFDGNGRTCSTCHLPEKNYNICPADIAELSAAQ